MNADIFAEFYRQCGYSVFRSASTWWYKVHPFFVMSLPYHREISLAEGELEVILGTHRLVVGARYFGPLSGPGKASFLIVCRDKKYNLQTLGQKARNQTRHGLRSCEVRRVSWGEAAAAYELQRDTCVRQGRYPEFTRRGWERLCAVAGDLPGFEAWGALVKGELGALSFVFHCDRYADILYQYSRNGLLLERPNNALVFKMTRELLARPETELVCYGPEPLGEFATLNRFKLEMGYVKQPTKQLAMISPRWRPMVALAAHSSVVKMVGWSRPGSSLRRTEGILNLVQATQPANGRGTLESTASGVVHARVADCDELARLHLAAFRGFFLSSLGPAFLSELYAALLNEPSSIALVARKQGRIAGFVFGVCRPRRFIVRVILRRTFAIAWALRVVAIRRPSAIVRVLWRGLQSPFQIARKGEAILLSIGVDPTLQRQGLGQELVDTFLSHAQRWGATRVVLTTDSEDNERVHRFYQKLGFRLRSEFLTMEKRKRSDYVIDLTSIAEIRGRTVAAL